MTQEKNKHKSLWWFSNWNNSKDQVVIGIQRSSCY